MQEFPVWPLVGLTFGTVLGIVGAFGGLSAFLIVLVLGVIGLFVGLVMGGDVRLPTASARRQ